MIAVSAVPRLSESNDAFCAKRFVDEAIVLKKVVLVALPKVVAPVKVLLPLNVLLFARRADPNVRRYRQRLPSGPDGL